MKLPTRPISAILLVASVGLAVQALSQTPTFEPAQSPRLAVLQKEVQRGNVEAVAAFWREMEARGTPLVESIPGDDERVIATFLWRGKQDTKGVLAVIPFRSSRSLLENIMAQVPGTDVWYRTLAIRSDLRFTYSFLPDPMAAAKAGVSLSDLMRLQQFDPLNPKAFHSPPDPEDPDANRIEGSIAEMPKAAPQPWIVKQAGVKEGKVEMHRFKSAILAKELVPWVRQTYRVTTDPSKTIVCGLSAGGLTAAYVAFKRPDLFGNVLAQSGAFWRGNEGDEVDHEWLTHQFEASPVLPIHFCIEAGLLEAGVPSPNNGPSLPLAAQHLRDVLKARGYPVVDYRDVPGNHEPLSWRGTFSDGLLFLLEHESRSGRTAIR